MRQLAPRGATSSVTTLKLLTRWVGRLFRTEHCWPSPRSTSMYLSPSIGIFSFQQDLSSFSIAVIVLAAKTNRLADLRPLIPQLLVAIETAHPGAAKFIGAS